MNRKEYLLICLAEELGEFQKEILKCLRFGPYNYCKETNSLNIERANQEYSDTIGIIRVLKEEGYILKSDEEQINKKIEKLERYFKISEAFNIVK